MEINTLTLSREKKERLQVFKFHNQVHETGGRACTTQTSDAKWDYFVTNNCSWITRFLYAQIYVYCMATGPGTFLLPVVVEKISQS